MRDLSEEVLGSRFVGLLLISPKLFKLAHDAERLCASEPDLAPSFWLATTRHIARRPNNPQGRSRAS
ncbi:hypothetical protein HOY34_14910 [Xinfangfangia sp. D13-10-4-6]|uniref:hypothetical protein n=1 Tax=Pseudogemmobacter hezensis TaxID=2737662 RepID=UPI001557295C|nr:hypothetical protein [Pseudogemmobacter hezensis]NPD16485.1 hypothetical protein [Pseudogemmobacter hezensis]